MADSLTTLWRWMRALPHTTSAFHRGFHDAAYKVEHLEIIPAFGEALYKMAIPIRILLHLLGKETARVVDDAVTSHTPEELAAITREAQIVATAAAAAAAAPLSLLGTLLTCVNGCFYAVGYALDPLGVTTSAGMLIYFTAGLAFFMGDLLWSPLHCDMCRCCRICCGLRRDTWPRQPPSRRCDWKRHVWTKFAGGSRHPTSCREMGQTRYLLGCFCFTLVALGIIFNALPHSVFLYTAHVFVGILGGL